MCLVVILVSDGIFMADRKFNSVYYVATSLIVCLSMIGAYGKRTLRAAPASFVKNPGRYHHRNTDRFSGVLPAH